MTNVRFFAVFAWGLFCAALATLFDVSGLTLEWLGIKLLTVGNKLHAPADRLIGYVFDLDFD
jgi:hypothetical protein